MMMLDQSQKCAEPFLKEVEETKSAFGVRLINRLFNAQFAECTDNYDESRLDVFGASISRKDKFKAAFRLILAKTGFYHRNRLGRPNAGVLQEWLPLLADLEWLCYRLADEQSRAILVDVIAYRIMGPVHVRLSLGTAAYRQRRQQLSSLADEKDTIEIGFNNWHLSRYDLTSMGYPISLYLRNPITTFAVEQYAYLPQVVASAGDVVIDGGGCYGDTALYFASKVGETGQVHVFEFVPENLDIARRNWNLNPQFASVIHLAENALWFESDKDIFIRPNGPASQVSMEPSTGYNLRRQTVTIDDYVHRKKLQRVDFIKLDIEGAEESALRGAERVIKTMKPKRKLINDKYRSIKIPACDGLST